MMNPVFKRELQNRMYGPTVYYLARLLSSLLMQVISPILVVTCFIFGIGIKLTFENIFLFYFSIVLLNMVSVAVGYFCGSAFEDEEGAKQM